MPRCHVLEMSFHCCSLFHFMAPYFNSFHFVSLHFTSFSICFTSFHFISLHFKFVSFHCTFTSFPFVSLHFTLFQFISRRKICFTLFHFILLHFSCFTSFHFISNLFHFIALSLHFPLSHFILLYFSSFHVVKFASLYFTLFYFIFLFPSPPSLDHFEAFSLLASNSALHLLSVCHTISSNGPRRSDLEVCRFKNNCRTSRPNFAPLRQRTRRRWSLKVPRRVLLYTWREHVLDIVSMTWSFDQEDLLKHPAL